MSIIMLFSFQVPFAGIQDSSKVSLQSITYAARSVSRAPQRAVSIETRAR